jgi:thiamine biosynthesis lipoprotein
LLGTIVSIRVTGLRTDLAERAIDAAFTEVACIHAQMSFHVPTSAVSRLNRMAHRRPVTVDARLYAVLRRALQIAEASGGLFDPTIAPELVAAGFLPVPHGAPTPDAAADFRDILLLPGRQVRFARPLWIDLGGIAKGYAVDRAIDRIKGFAPAQICINAGGDLRVWGAQAERVALGAGANGAGEIPMIEITDGALASSCCGAAQRLWRGRMTGPHLDGRRRLPVPPERFASVVAPHCMDADALTKVALADPAGAPALLAHYGARAFVFEADGTLVQGSLAA